MGGSDPLTAAAETFLTTNMWTTSQQTAQKRPPPSTQQLFCRIHSQLQEEERQRRSEKSSSSFCSVSCSSRCVGCPLSSCLKIHELHSDPPAFQREVCVCVSRSSAVSSASLHFLSARNPTPRLGPEDEWSLTLTGMQSHVIPALVLVDQCRDSAFSSKAFRTNDD